MAIIYNIVHTNKQSCKHGCYFHCLSHCHTVLLLLDLHSSFQAAADGVNVVLGFFIPLRGRQCDGHPRVHYATEPLLLFPLPRTALGRSPWGNSDPLRVHHTD